MAAATRDMFWELMREELLLVSYSEGSGTEEEWRAYLATLRDLTPQESKVLRILAFAGGTPPREALDGVMSAARGKTWRVALISPSTAVRFVASTFSFVIRTLRFFAPTELAAALDHLACSEAERAKIVRTLARMGAPEASLRL